MARAPFPNNSSARSAHGRGLAWRCEVINRPGRGSPCRPSTRWIGQGQYLLEYQVRQPRGRPASRRPMSRFSLYNAYNFNLPFYIYVFTNWLNSGIKRNVSNWRNHLYELFSFLDSYTSMRKILRSLYFLCIF